MATEAQTCAIGILTILNILVALHLSRALYKSTLFMQNKPNLLDTQMNVNPVKTRVYENVRPFSRRENKPNQTQFQSQKNAASSSKNYICKQGIEQYFGQILLQTDTIC